MNAMSFDLHDYAAQAKASGLRYVSDAVPGFTRRRYGKSFVFFDKRGERIRDEAEIQRIRKLAIPPAYKDVWICPHPNGHIQATGIDAKGRKQYRYHADWRACRDATKFTHMLAFGDALPQIRAVIAGHMAQRSLSREKVLATVVALLEKTLIRVGNDEYARNNGSYGLTTLRDEHVSVEGSTIRFRFKGKSGKQWNLKVSDRRIAKVVRACADIEGQELFKYIDEAGEVRDLTSGDVNAYLRDITGEAFTAKDFRTWTGTVLAAMALSEYREVDSEAQAKKNVVAAIERVSARLGNTPSVCRKSYVHPEVINAYLDGDLVRQIDGEIGDALDDAGLKPEETCVLTLLRRRLAED
ncbi:DNA topoisomerase IB [Asticcacaulis solisilvae]|uniref:DNA topoisomerase IB n=1 Tax=Asticcacaulis solisilvae TaxID=1217274 RepID=UPI003FD7FDD4